MAKIRKIYDQTIKPDGSKTTIYPITSTRAVYTPEGETLDSYLKDGYFHGADLAGYKVVSNVSQLPTTETSFGYLMDSNLYVWVGTGGNTLDGKYQNCGPFRGPNGESAYEVAVHQGYVGTEEQWLNDPLNGIKGNGMKSVSVVGDYDPSQSANNTYRITPDVGAPFDFVVKNGKGIVGAQQVIASQEDGGTNIIRVFLSDNSYVDFSFKNGQQGNSGYTGAAGELEVVNNLQDGGAAKALSAEQGKVLVQKYGDDESNGSGYIATLLDSDDRVVVGIEPDGDIYIGYGVPDQIVTYIAPIKNKTDRIEVEPNGSWIEASVDEDGKVFTGTRKDGTFYAVKMDSPTLDEIKEQIGGAISVTKSSYIDPDEDTNAHLLAPPALTESYEVVNVSTEVDLNAAITRYISGENIYARLQNDLELTGAKSISGASGELVIDGLGHKVIQKSATYSPNGYAGGFAYANANISGVKKTFVDDKGNTVGFSTTKFYEAAGRVTDEGGNTFPDSTDGRTAGVRRFLLPKELYDLEIAEGNDVWINLSCWFVAYTVKVLYTQDHYIYFQYNGGYNIDGDYYFAKKYTSFYFINLDKTGGSAYYNSNKLYFDSSQLVDCGNFAGFNIQSNTGIVKFCNINFLGASAGQYFINVTGSKVIIDKCGFDGFINYCIGNASSGEVYISNSNFKNFTSGVVFSDVDTKCYISSSQFKDCGLWRNNDPVIRLYGEYYVANNIIEDYGYSAIGIGKSNLTEQHDCGGIVEYNTIRQTAEYLKYAHHKTVMDGGAIYIATNNYDTIIRYNRIINYIGRSNNLGIFCDDGAYNIKIYSNLIENTPDNYSISARYATGRSTAGNTDNVNKVIAQNVVTNPIWLEGNPNVTNNGCLLGYNIITGLQAANRINNLEGQETQTYTLGVNVHDGVCQSGVSFDNWKI